MSIPREYGPILDAVRGLTWPARRRVSGTHTGTHLSRLRGRAPELSEYRLYRQGDDPRQLDGLEVSVYVVRGPRGEPDERGRLLAREYYQGPLRLRMVGTDGLDHELAFVTQILT